MLFSFSTPFQEKGQERYFIVDGNTPSLEKLWPVRKAIGKKKKKLVSLEKRKEKQKVKQTRTKSKKKRSILYV